MFGSCGNQCLHDRCVAPHGRELERSQIILVATSWRQQRGTIEGTKKKKKKKQK